MDRLPFSREEVLSIGALFPAAQRQLYFGALATEDTMKRENLSEYSYIHFATHSFLDETAPDRSGILLSRDPSSRDFGHLQAGDILPAARDWARSQWRRHAGPHAGFLLRGSAKPDCKLMERE